MIAAFNAEHSKFADVLALIENGTTARASR